MGPTQIIFLFLMLSASAFAVEEKIVKLRVTDNFTHLPIAGAEIYLAEEEGEKAFRKVGATTDRSFFALELQNAAARCQIEIRAEGYDSYRSPRFVAAESAAFIDVPLARLMDFEGVIVAPTGQRAGGAQYFLCTDLTQVNFLSGRTFSTRSRQPETTGPSGKFRLSPEPTGHAILVAHDLGFALRPLAGWTNGGAVQLEPWARIAGRLSFNGVAASNQVVEIMPTRPLLNRTRAVFLDFERRTDTNGFFEFTNVPPMAVTFWRKVHRPRAEDGTEWIHTNAKDLVVEPGDTRSFDIDFRGREISGRFVSASIERLENVKPILASIRRTNEIPPLEFSAPSVSGAVPQNLFAVMVGEDLRFTGEIIPPGKYRVSARIDNAAWSGGLEVPEGMGAIDLGTVPLSRDAP